MRQRRFTVGVLGARGHVGAELLPLLGAHPEMELAAVISRAYAGRAVAEVLPGTTTALRYEDLAPAEAAARGLDAWILALPNGEAAPWVTALTAARGEVVLVDLSADYRFSADWIYGLVERDRNRLAGARRIANPGCYATGMQLALWPLLPVAAGPATAFGVSGYSGAGTTPSPRNDVNLLRDNLMPYQLVGHLHEREVSHHLAHPVHFLPHVAPFFRGITLSISLPLSAPLTALEVEARFRDHYAGEPLVRVQREAPLVRDAAGRHHVTLGGFTVAREAPRAVVVATLDNLLKGAATQTLQNLNLALGLPELLGLVLP